MHVGPMPWFHARAADGTIETHQPVSARDASLDLDLHTFETLPVPQD